METQVFVDENQALLPVPGGDLELLRDAQVVVVSRLHRQTCYFWMCVRVHMCVLVCVCASAFVLFMLEGAVSSPHS